MGWLKRNKEEKNQENTKQALDDVGMGNLVAKYDGPHGTLVTAIDNLKQTIPVHRAASQRFNSMQGQLGEELVNVNKEIAKAKQKYKDWNFTTEDGKQVNKGCWWRSAVCNLGPRLIVVVNKYPS